MIALNEFLKLLEDELRITEPVDPDTPLLSTAVIDSFDVVALLSVIEDRYGVEIDPESIDVASFDTPTQMLERIEKARAELG